MYVGVVGYFVIGLIYTASFGNFRGVLLEAAIAMVAD
jgi:hypothetical protein